MMALSDFPVARRWTPRHPEKLQLYSLPTPNGVKVSIMLEETSIPYEAHKIDFATGDQKTPEYLALNPNGKIPAIIDPDGPGGQPLALYESGAILLYLAGKSRMFLPSDPAQRLSCIQWVMWQLSMVGPMFGQVGYFHKFEGREIEDKRPLKHYAEQSKRLLRILDDRVADHDWVMGDAYTVADISLIGMVRNLVEYYKAGELVDYASFAHVHRWLDRAGSRPAVQRGLTIPG